MARVIVISNCQYKPVVAAWKMMRPQDDVEGYEVHTLIGKAAEIAGAKRRLATCDIILHIPIADDYPVEFARSSSVKALVGGDKVTMPMLFFEGLHPDIRYLGTAEARVSSPMGDYHSLIVLRQFLQGKSADETDRAIFSEEEYARLGYFERFDASLQELERRDRACDLPAVKTFKSLLYKTPTLFTVNHPTNCYVKAMVIEIFKLLSLQYDDAPAEMIAVSLAGGPIWPIPACIVRRHDIAYAPWHAFKTNEGGQRVMDAAEFIRKSFYIYARNLRAILDSPQAKREMPSIGIDPEDCDWLLAERAGRLSRYGKLWSPPTAGADPGAEPNVAEVVHGTWIDEDAPRSVLDLLESAIWNSPCDSALLKAYAEELARTASPEDVEAFYRSAAELAPVPDELFAALIAFQLERLGPGPAVSAARAWVGKSPSSGAAWSTLARIMHSLRNVPEALQAAEKAVSIDPENRSYLTVLCHRLMDANQPDMAAAQVRIIARKFGENAHDLALLGLARRQTGQLDEAEQALERAIQLEPDLIAFRHLLFSVLMLAGKSSAARELCEEMVRRAADRDIWEERRVAINAAGTG